ncbi:MAG: hypothetical protein D6823_04040, partial [Chloroflexi bacterium]
GIIFYSFASLSLPGLSGAILGSINLALGVTAVLLSLALIEYPGGQLAATTRRDLFWQRPMAGAGLLGGGLALIGWFPFPGGTSYLLALQAAAAINWIEVLVLTTAMALAALTLVQLTIQYLLGPRESSPTVETPPLEESDLNRLAPSRHVGEPMGIDGIIGVLLVVIIVIGLFPNLLLPTIEAAVRSLAVLSAS